MSIRTFWIILLKIIGLYLVFYSLTVIYSTMTSLFSARFAFDNGDLGYWSNILFIIPIAIFYFLVLRLFLFKSAWVIDKLKLDKGFEEERLDLNFSKSAVLSISVIVIGGLMFADYFPSLIRSCFSFYQSKSIFRENTNSGNLLFQFARTLIAFLLMTNYKSIVNYLVLRESSKVED